MADAPYTAFRELQWRGPSDSSDYNARVESIYKDLVISLNRGRITQADLEEGFGQFIKDQSSLLRVIEDLESRVADIEAARNILTFAHSEQVDTDRFDSTPFEVAEANSLSLAERYGVLTLPRIETSGLSKLAFTNDLGDVVIPSTLETAVVGANGTADDPDTATIDTSEPELAIARGVGRIWQRNVIVPAPVTGGAICYLYVKAPTDLFTTDKSNSITLSPFPAMGTDILEVAATTNVDLMLQDTDGYTVINSHGYHSNDPQAIGWVPPGGWSGDAARNASPKIYYFDPSPITGIRIKLGQRNYYRESGNYIYSYGLTNLDLRYEKFLSTGVGMIRFDAPASTIINNITSVQPEIWNIAEADIQNCFSYRVLYETSYNSGVYTESHVPSNKRVWIEVTLTKTAGGGTPALSGLKIEYDGITTIPYPSGLLYPA